NILTWIETAEGLALSSQKGTDASGHVLYDPLGEGNYRIAFRRSDCWPAVLETNLGNSEKAARDVQMRRLANLELTALNAKGIPVSGVPISLTSTEFATPVQSWIDGGRVHSRTGLTTD